MLDIHKGNQNTKIWEKSMQNEISHINQYRLNHFKNHQIQVSTFLLRIIYTAVMLFMRKSKKWIVKTKSVLTIIMSVLHLHAWILHNEICILNSWQWLLSLGCYYNAFEVGRMCNFWKKGLRYPPRDSGSSKET